jgi:DNA-binding XRE family transcriptional regulator
MELHEIIRQCRKARHFSQEYMGHELGMSQPTYSRLEHGDWLIDDALLVKIANLLQVCPKQLGSGNELVFMAALHTSPDSTTDVIRQKNAMIQTLTEMVQRLRAENMALLQRLVAYKSSGGGGGEGGGGGGGGCTC